MNSPRKMLVRSLGVILFIGIAFFAYTRIEQYIKGPFLSDISLVSPSVVDTAVVPISGTIVNTNVVMINGHVVGVSEEGVFNETVVLVPGSNIIEVQLGDSFGKQRDYHYEIYFDGDVPYVPLLQNAQEQLIEPQPTEETEIEESE